jgi:lauroyl/myristoyl acyltransferase
VSRLVSRARLFELASAIVSRIPPSIWPLLWTIGGCAAYLTLKDVRKVVRRNQTVVLTQVLGRGIATSFVVEVSTFRAFVSYARYFVELFGLARMSVTDIASDIVSYGGEEFFDRLHHGKPCVAVLAHLGNWEWGGAWASVAFGGLTTVAEHLKDESMTRWFADFRERLGMNIVLLGERAPRELLRELRSGKLVALVADRDVAGTGESTTMFGHRVKLPAGPAVLSVLTGAPIFPVGTYHGKAGTHIVRFYPKIEPATGKPKEAVREMLDKLAIRFEEMIGQAPHQWHNFQPYFFESDQDRSDEDH